MQKQLPYVVEIPKDNRGGKGIDRTEADIVNAGGKADTEITSLEDDVHLYPKVYNDRRITSGRW